MAAQSSIEWTDSTFNPWVGCTKIKRPGNKPSACDFCYAEKWAKRSGMVTWGNHPRRRTTESYWRGPLNWNSRAPDFHRTFGRRRRAALGPLGTIEVGGKTPDWIIIGGESGVSADFARPTRPEWVRDVIAECRQHNVAPFLKQWGSYSNNPLVVENGLTIKEAMQEDPPVNGKGGGKLDDQIWREFPRKLIVDGTKRPASSKHKVRKRELMFS